MSRSNAMSGRGVSRLLGVSFAFFLAASAAAQQPAPRSDASLKLEAETRKAKDNITKIGAGKDVTIVRRDKQEFYGSIVSVNQNTVIVSDVDLKANVEIGFDQITSVEKGYGTHRGINGKRVSPKKNRIGWIVAVAGAAVVMTVILVTISNPKF